MPLRVPGRARTSRVRGGARSQKPTATSAASAAILISINPLAALLPGRTPRALIAVNAAIAPMPQVRAGSSTGESGATYAPKAMAAAAMPPLCATRSAVHPYEKATSGPYASLK